MEWNTQFFRYNRLVKILFCLHLVCFLAYWILSMDNSLEKKSMHFISEFVTPKRLIDSSWQAWGPKGKMKEESRHFLHQYELSFPIMKCLKGPLFVNTNSRTWFFVTLLCHYSFIKCRKKVFKCWRCCQMSKDKIVPMLFN